MEDQPQNQQPNLPPQGPVAPPPPQGPTVVPQQPNLGQPIQPGQSPAQPQMPYQGQPQANMGGPTNQTVPPTPGGEQKDFTTALLLSILVGSLGVDRFYLGYTGLGVIKLGSRLV